MGSAIIKPLSARGLRGAVMGSPQATTLLTLRVQGLPLEVIQRARAKVAAQLPRWISDADTSQSMDQVSADGSTLVLLSELIAAIQAEAGIAVGKALGVSPPVSADRVAMLYLPTHSLKASEIAINWACELLNALLGVGGQVDVGAAIETARQQLKPFADKGVNNFFILQAAYALGIPVFRQMQGLLVLGTGSRSRWLQSLISDETKKLGVQFAQAKHVTASLLRTAGLPGGIHRLVKTKEQAMEAAEALGYPVVVKPADADQGAGVAAGLTDVQSVALAFDAAFKVSHNVLVECWAPGHTHRLTVQDGQVIRVVRRIAGGVVGDGVRTVAELVALFQQSPKQQRIASRLGYQPLSLDEEAMALLGKLGLTEQSRPAEGIYIKLRRRDNVNAGGVNEELVLEDTSLVHPDNLRLAIDATRVLRLDFAGIDLITTDISRSWLEVDALICEVNARPQMGGANDPGLYKRLLSRMFPNGAKIPVELLVVPTDPAEQGRIKDCLLRDRVDVAVSLTAGLWIDGTRSTQAFKHSFEAAQSLLQRREVQHAICCMTTKDIHRYGLPLQRWNAVTVVTDAVFTQDEAAQLVSVRDWLQVAVQT
jgi:cyanophycin synthetase